MHNLKKLLLLLPVSFASVFALSSCGSNSEARVLRILNCEDYIYEYLPEYDEDDMDKRDMVDQFKDYWLEKTGEEIDVVYDTFDTNETMFNELQTGKTTYDVIVPSDYMIQKLISHDMLEPFDTDLIDVTNEDGVWYNISSYLKDKFDGITATKLDDENAVAEPISLYSVPYMWGTVGVMYNPSFYHDNESYDGNLDEDYVHELFSDWDSLYGEELQGTFSIKDSVRDTYAITLVHALRDEVASAENNEELTAIFNRHDTDTMQIVKEDMIELKNNAFGFECDSGKTDMTTRKIGANMCWSGDATWAITEAEGNDLELYYSIPTTYDGQEYKSASNVWFDGFCMPKSDKLNKDLAQEFIKFMSFPENAVQNCYAVGYTPGVSGHEMLEYILGEYEATATRDWYKDCLDSLDSTKFKTVEEYEEEKSELETLIADETEWINANAGSQENYYDLRYFYGDDCDDAYFLPCLGSVGRQLTAQYPSAEMLPRLAIMNDFGTEGTIRLLDMWEQVRTNPLPTWGIITFIVEGVAALALGFYFVKKVVIRKKVKKARI